MDALLTPGFACQLLTRQEKLTESMKSIEKPACYVLAAAGKGPQGEES